MIVDRRLQLVGGHRDELVLQAVELGQLGDVPSDHDGCGDHLALGVPDRRRADPNVAVLAEPRVVDVPGPSPRRSRPTVRATWPSPGDLIGRPSGCRRWSRLGNSAGRLLTSAKLATPNSRVAPALVRVTRPSLPTTKTASTMLSRMAWSWAARRWASRASSSQSAQQRLALLLDPPQWGDLRAGHYRAANSPVGIEEGYRAYEQGDSASVGEQKLQHLFLNRLARGSGHLGGKLLRLELPGRLSGPCTRPPRRRGGRSARCCHPLGSA